MNNQLKIRIDTARRALQSVLTAANGGKAPRITVHVADDDAPVPAFDVNGTTDTLFAAFDKDGGLGVAVGIRTHWTMLWHFGFRMARTPSGQFALLCTRGGKSAHATVEDGRFLFEEGSPLLGVADEREAVAGFEAEFAARMAEAK